MALEHHRWNILLFVIIVFFIILVAQAFLFWKVENRVSQAYTIEQQNNQILTAVTKVSKTTIIDKEIVNQLGLLECPISVDFHIKEPPFCSQSKSH